MRWCAVSEKDQPTFPRSSSRIQFHSFSTIIVVLVQNSELSCHFDLWGYQRKLSVPLILFGIHLSSDTSEIVRSHLALVQNPMEYSRHFSICGQYYRITNFFRETFAIKHILFFVSILNIETSQTESKFISWLFRISILRIFWLLLLY